ncbi:MAG TPA: hypothetical protein VN700_08800 [Vicinamibacterales bacterium]|nr:hypothetical protein [Vicinamibacterales bacterium]
MQQPKQDAFVVTVVREPEKEMTVPELVIGSLGIAGSLLLLALVLGAIAGGWLVIWNRFRPASRRHLPPVRPGFTDAGLPPT